MSSGKITAAKITRVIDLSGDSNPIKSTSAPNYINLVFYEFQINNQKYEGYSILTLEDVYKGIPIPLTEGNPIPIIYLVTNPSINKPYSKIDTVQKKKIKDILFVN